MLSLLAAALAGSLLTSAAPQAATPGPEMEPYMRRKRRGAVKAVVLSPTARAIRQTGKAPAGGAQEAARRLRQMERKAEKDAKRAARLAKS